MADSHSIIRFLNDCYQEENSRSVLWNLFSSSVSHRLFFKQEELIDGFLHESIIPGGGTREAMEASALYRKERELLYGTLFIVGKMRVSKKDTRVICSPILTWPASLQLTASNAQSELLRDMQIGTASIDLDGRRINHRLLAELNEDDEEGEPTPGEPLEEILEASGIQPETIQRLSQYLGQQIEGLTTEAMESYPRLLSREDLESMVEAAGQGRSGRFKLVPAAAVFLVQRSLETRGILTELQQLTQAPLSMPLQHLLASDQAGLDRSSTTSRDERPRVPAILSGPQVAMVWNAREKPLSVVIGPPGTGKSFTIASMAVDHLMRGESVLIGSRMDHAVDVIADKIQRQLGIEAVLVRTGRKGYRRELKSYLDSLITGLRRPVEELDDGKSLEKLLVQSEK
ncbi:MAG: AAA domain-containing protein, partial [Verrucomicrobiota bacterium]